MSAITYTFYGFTLFGCYRYSLWHCCCKLAQYVVADIEIGEHELVLNITFVSKSLNVEGWTYPSPPSTGSLIRRRKSAWCSCISLIRWGFCLPSSWSMGCQQWKHWKENLHTEFLQMVQTREELRSETCKICGLAWTIARKAWNWEWQ